MVYTNNFRFLMICRFSRSLLRHTRPPRLLRLGPSGYFPFIQRLSRPPPTFLISSYFPCMLPPFILASPFPSFAPPAREIAALISAHTPCVGETLTPSPSPILFSHHLKVPRRSPPHLKSGWCARREPPFIPAWAEPWRIQLPP